jgi:hypothetical protein
MAAPKTWQALYTMAGFREAMATVVALEDGSFLVAAAATGRTENRRDTGAPVCRLYTTLSEAKARADAVVVALLGRGGVGEWHGP